MSNKDFEVEQVDMLGARASRDKGIGAEFPQRVETSTDLNYYERAKVIDTKLKFDKPSSTLYEVKKKLSESELALLVRSNAYLGKIKKGIQRNANRRQNCTRMLALTLKDDIKMTPTLNDRFLRLQDNSFEVIGIYDGYNLTPSALQAQIKDSFRTMAELGIKPKRVNVRMPMLQRPEILKAKMAVAFAETDGVALKHSSFERAKRQYGMVRSFAGRGKWVHMYDMRSVWTGNYRTSLMHIAQLLSIDSFALRTGSKPPKNIAPVTPKRLDMESLGALTIQEHTQRYGHELYCACPLCIGKTMFDMQDNYSPYERYPIFRSHSAYASNFEFALDRQAILNEGKHLLNRLGNKEFMAEPFKYLYKTDINSMASQARL